MKYLISTGRKTITGDVTPISAIEENRIGMVIKSLASNGEPVYLGGPNVTDDTGYPLDPGESMPTGTFDGAIYGITEGGSCEVAIFKTLL